MTLKNEMKLHHVTIKSMIIHVLTQNPIEPCRAGKR